MELFLHCQSDKRLLSDTGFIYLESTTTAIQHWAPRRGSVIIGRQKQVLVLRSVRMGKLVLPPRFFPVSSPTRSTFLDNCHYAHCLQFHLPRLHLAIAVFACTCWFGCAKQHIQGPGQSASAPKPFHTLCLTSSLVGVRVIFMLWRIWALVKSLLGNQPH